MAKEKRDPGRLMVSASMLFFMSAFLLISFKTETPDLSALALAAGVPVMLWIGTMLLPKIFPADKLLLTITNFLCGIGVLILYSTSPEHGIRQAKYYAYGIAAMVLVVFVVRFVKMRWKWPTRLLWLGSLAVLALPIAIGTEVNGAKNWLIFGSFSLQPSELVKLTLIIVCAYYMSRRKMMPWLIFFVGCIGLIVLQKDLGAVLLYFSVALFMFYASSSNIMLSLAAIGMASGGAVLAYQMPMFAHVKRRVAIWQNPWRDAQGAGYQIVQSLVAIASGGLFGVGLGLGMPTVIPVYESDMIFAVICEQFGILFGLCILLMYIILILRGINIALAARSRFHGLLAMGCVVLLAVQTVVIVGGVIKMIPLTGVTMPFISAGGSSLVSSFCLIGLLQGVASLNEDDLKADARLAQLSMYDGGEMG